MLRCHTPLCLCDRHHSLSVAPSLVLVDCCTTTIFSFLSRRSSLSGAPLSGSLASPSSYLERLCPTLPRATTPIPFSGCHAAYNSPLSWPFRGESDGSLSTTRHLPISPLSPFCSSAFPHPSVSSVSALSFSLSLRTIKVDKPLLHLRGTLPGSPNPFALTLVFAPFCRRRRD